MDGLEDCSLGTAILLGKLLPLLAPGPLRMEQNTSWLATRSI